MKKYLLLASSAIFSISSFAQANQEIELGLKWLQHTQIDAQSTNILVKKNNIPNNKAASTIEIGTSFNVYGILGDRQNQVVYNKDINTVAFVHRQNAGGAGGTNATGIISLDYSTDGGATWTVNPFQTTPTGSGATWNGNRYPNMGIYNPAANTDPANAFMVQAGPALETGAASNENGWSSTFRSSFKLDGSLVDETYDNNSISSQGNKNEWGTAGLYVTSQGTAWYVSTNSNNSSNTSPNSAFDVADNYSQYQIIKGIFNATNNNFDWSVASTINPAWNTTDNNGTPWNMAGLPNMAWSVDGVTGYMVVMGSWDANTMYRPYVMKTTDAGATWNNVNDNDFSLDATFQARVPAFDLGNPTAVRPWFSGYDMVVGSDDELKIFVDVQAQSSDHPDSLLFTYSSSSTHGLYEVATNATSPTGWDVTFVDSIYVEDHQWDATNNLSHFVRPQASRSQDGTKVFYSWIGSNILLSSTREFPEVWAVGHDIGGTEPKAWSQFKNLSAGTAAKFVSGYQTVAVDVIENGNDQDWELPIVYATALGGEGLSNAVSTPQWTFLKGAGFSADDFSLVNGNDGNIGSGGNIGNTVGVDEKVMNDENIQIFPNPSTGFITLQIANTKDFNYTIVDIVGNMVKSNHVNGNTTIIDLTNNAKGIYFVNINNGVSTITKKVILSK